MKVCTCFIQCYKYCWVCFHLHRFTISCCTLSKMCKSACNVVNKKSLCSNNLRIKKKKSHLFLWARTLQSFSELNYSQLLCTCILIWFDLIRFKYGLLFEEKIIITTKAETNQIYILKARNVHYNAIFKVYSKEYNNLQNWNNNNINKET